MREAGAVQASGHVSTFHTCLDVPIGEPVQWDPSLPRLPLVKGLWWLRTCSVGPVAALFASGKGAVLARFLAVGTEENLGLGVPQHHSQSHSSFFDSLSLKSVCLLLWVSVLTY